MNREFSFNLTFPVNDLDTVEKLLDQAKQSCPAMRIGRKPDRLGNARFYLSFPFSDARPDLSFQQWFLTVSLPAWELFGPTPGRWGLIQ